MILHIPDEEKFMGFIEFNSFFDVGFKPTGLSTNTSTKFAYLTVNDVTQKMVVNLLIIDPYFDEI
jgi:hypothetical protein